MRPRVLDYEEALRAAGISLRFLPFLTSRGFSGFYSTDFALRARKALHGAVGLVRRLLEIGRSGGFPAALVHREILPRGNRQAVRALKRRGLRLAFDLDDATFLSPRDFVDISEASHRRMSRLKDPREVDALLAAADIVLAGNETIAEHARLLCSDVRVQPTPVDTERFRPRPRPERRRPLVGWIGSPTATYCLKAIAPALTRARKEAPFDLLVVGAGEAVAIPGVEVHEREWTLESETRRFAGLDIGIYPLPDNPWTRGKCGMKALQYGACEVASVASPVGVNREIVVGGETGFLARDEDEWVEYLLRYLGDPDLRARHGRAARERVSRRWSLAALAPGFVGAMEDLLA